MYAPTFRHLLSGPWSLVLLVSSQLINGKVLFLGDWCELLMSKRQVLTWSWSARELMFCEEYVVSCNVLFPCHSALILVVNAVSETSFQGNFYEGTQVNVFNLRQGLAAPATHNNKLYSKVFRIICYWYKLNSHFYFENIRSNYLMRNFFYFSKIRYKQNNKKDIYIYSNAVYFILKCIKMCFSCFKI